MRRIILACAVAGVLGVPAKADETLKFRQSVHMTSMQSQQVGDVDGHILGLNKFSGTAFLTDGRVGAVTGWAQTDFVKGSGTLSGYASLTFDDGSVLWLKWSGTAVNDGKTVAEKGTQTIIGGKGRYEGAKGDSTWTLGWAGLPGPDANPYVDIVINIKK